MDSFYICLIVAVQILEPIKCLQLVKDLPHPWTNPKGCGVDDPYYDDNFTAPAICDPDGVLPLIHRMITNDFLQNCRHDSTDGTIFQLYVAANVTGMKNNRDSKGSAVDKLIPNAVLTYNLTHDQETSTIFILVTKEPFQIKYWVTSSLTSKFKSSHSPEVFKNVTASFKDNKQFPSAVNKAVNFFCQSIRAPPHQPLRSDGLTIFWMFFVIVLIVAVSVLVIHLIIVRYKATHHKGGDLRITPGRPNLGPLSMEMDDFGITPFEPSGNLLLSTTDVTAIPQPHSSTANLLDTVAE